MGKISAPNLREKTDQELLDQMALEKKRIFEATVRGASGEAIKSHEKREGKRLIARIQTVIRERALRRGLELRITELTPQAKGAGTRAAKLAAREPRPQFARVVLRDPAGLSQADRAAVRLAEAKRRRAALVREDAGQTR